MNKYLFILYIALCVGCTSNTNSAKTICEQLLSQELSLETVDSLVSFAEKMSDGEYTSIYLAGAEQICRFRFTLEKSGVAESYIQKARLRAPIYMRTDVSLAHFNWIYLTMMANKQENYSELLPMITQLMYELDNKSMSKQQQIDYLLLKSKIYSRLYQFGKALELISEAETIAKEKKLPEYVFQSVKNKHFIFAMMDDQANERALLLELINMTDNSEEKKIFYYRLYYIDNTNGDYPEALKWYHLYLKNNSLRGDQNETTYSMKLADLYTKTDSFPQAFKALEVTKRYKMTTFQLASWERRMAKIYLELRDTAQYENHMTSYIAKSQANTIDSIKRGAILSVTAVSEYAKILWEKKQVQQAIRNMEMTLPQIRYSFCKNDHQQIHSLPYISEYLACLKQLREYYGKMGRYHDAFLLQQSCDTLSSILYENEKKDEYLRISRESENQKLYSQLNLQREQLRVRMNLLQTTLVLLIGISVCFTLLYLAYRQRKRQLHILYLKQKEIERLQDVYAPEAAEEITADKQLFYDIEQCIQDNELFRQFDFSRDELCKRMGTNRMYVSSCINKYAKMNFNQWINKARVQYAIKLIHAGEYRLNVLSISSGFASSTSFFRNFKQYTLLTPNQYIEQEKKSVSRAKHIANTQTTQPDEG